MAYAKNPHFSSFNFQFIYSLNMLVYFYSAQGLGGRA